MGTILRTPVGMVDKGCIVHSVIDGHSQGIYATFRQ